VFSRLGGIGLADRRVPAYTGPGSIRRPRACTPDYLYSTDELGQWKSRIEHVARFAETVFVVTNSDSAGKSVVNALQIQALIGLGNGRTPRQLAASFRGELDYLEADAPVQNFLFPGGWQVA
jgi:uncharacterized protein YecE (DUF72 family)